MILDTIQAIYNYLGISGSIGLMIDVIGSIYLFREFSKPIHTDY
nr:hypothetical protein [Aeromonas sp. Ne-1]